jgi:hypothetical protein
MSIVIYSVKEEGLGGIGVVDIAKGRRCGPQRLLRSGQIEGQPSRTRARLARLGDVGETVVEHCPWQGGNDPGKVAR